jgi:protein gp37
MAIEYDQIGIWSDVKLAIIREYASAYGRIMEATRRDRVPSLRWLYDIRDQCVVAGVAFFFKQWGGVQKKKTGRTLEGRTWDEMPVQIELAMV